MAAFESHGNIIFVMFACDQFPKEENLSDDEASFLDLESKKLAIKITKVQIWVVLLMTARPTLIHMTLHPC